MSIVKVLTDEELEAALNDESQPSVPSKPVPLKVLTKSRYSSDRHIKVFSDFKDKHNLKKGECWVEPGILFYLYDNWAHQTKRVQMSYQKFSDFCQLFLNVRLVNNDKWYGISEEFKQQYLTQDVLDKATDWSRKHRGIQKTYRKKANKKK